MKSFQLYTLLILLMSIHACQGPEKKGEGSAEDTKQYEAGTFGYDLKFLKTKDSVFVLKNKSGDGQIIVSAQYQAKVFTSTANGLEGRSFGWVNYEAFE